jgi:hypothetical protein
MTLMINLRKTYSYLVLSTVILLLAVTPAHGIRLVNVELLFEITDQLNQPSEVAVSKDGQIYVVDGVNNRIRIYSSRGAPVSSFGVEGAGDGEFKYPLGIDIPDTGGFLWPTPATSGSRYLIAPAVLSPGLNFRP